MSKMSQKLHRSRQAATTVSYGLLLGLIAVSLITSLSNVGDRLNEIFMGATNVLAGKELPNSGPQMVDVTALPSAGVYAEGDVLSVTVSFNEPIQYSGTPRLSFIFENGTAFAPVQAQPSGSQLTFSYTIGADDVDTDGIVLVSSLDLNGGEITDQQGAALSSTTLPSFTLPEITILGICEVPRSSCLEHATYCSADGLYPIGKKNSATSYETYCDMTGGGWTLAGVQIGTAFFARTISDISSSNFGSLTATWRLGNTKIQNLTPIEAWRIESRDTSTGATVDEVYFQPSCVIDWNQNVGTWEGGPFITECATGYTSSSFTTMISNYVEVNSALGIGMNNEGKYCSIRMGEANYASVGHSGAYSCDGASGLVRNIFLWMK